MTEARFRNLSSEQKRNETISNGTEIIFLHCPLCQLNKPVKVFLEDKGDKSYLVEIRKGGGKGRGFYKTGALSLSQSKKSYPELIKQIKARCKAILQELK